MMKTKVNEQMTLAACQMIQGSYQSIDPFIFVSVRQKSTKIICALVGVDPLFNLATKAKAIEYFILRNRSLKGIPRHIIISWVNVALIA